MNGPAISAIDGWAVLTYGSEQYYIVHHGGMQHHQVMNATAPTESMSVYSWRVNSA